MMAGRPLRRECRVRPAVASGTSLHGGDRAAGRVDRAAPAPAFRGRPGAGLAGNVPGDGGGRLMQRYRTVIVLALLSAIPLISAVFAVRLFLSEDRQEPPSPEMVEEQEAPPPVEPPVMLKVLSAARPLPVGTLLGDGDLVEIELASNEVRTEHFVADGMTELRGYVVREAIPANAPITRSEVIGPGQAGFLAAVLEPGTRAVTIELETVARQAGLINPGDRVDVILTAEINSAEWVQGAFTRTIVEDARVVALDSNLGQADEDGLIKPELLTATLEVRPFQAELLVLGKREGLLSLAVRSLAAGAVGRGPSSDAVDLLGALSPTPPPPPKTVRVTRGGEVMEETFPGPAATGAPPMPRAPALIPSRGVAE